MKIIANRIPAGMIYRRVKYATYYADRCLVSVHKDKVSKTLLQTNIPYAMAYTVVLGLVLLSYSFDKSLKIGHGRVEVINEDNEPEIERVY